VRDVHLAALAARRRDPARLGCPGLSANVGRTRLLVLLAAFLIAVSGAIGLFHAGVEYGWWEGITLCTTNGASSLEDILKVPLVRCDQVQWSLLGISLAGWNAILSLGGAAVIAALAVRKPA
jgi:disulfide bond formation protein DsbB